MESRPRCTQIVNQLFNIFGCESQRLGSAATVPLEVREVLVLYVTTQRIAHDLALCLAGRAGERFCLGGQLVRDRYRKETGHMKSSYRGQGTNAYQFLASLRYGSRTSEGLS